MCTRNELILALEAEGITTTYDGMVESYFIYWARAYNSCSYLHPDAMNMSQDLPMMWLDEREDVQGYLLRPEQIYISSLTSDFYLEYLPMTVRQAVTQIAGYVAGTYFESSLTVNASGQPMDEY